MKISDIDTIRSDKARYEVPEEEIRLTITRAERDYLKTVLKEKRRSYKAALKHHDLKPSTRERCGKVLGIILSLEDKIR